MSLSCHDQALGTYDTARLVFDKMLKVPIFGGTFEFQNAVIARQFNFFADNLDRGTVADLTTAIDLEAPTILLVNPDFFGIGHHDVVLVGYSVDPHGAVVNLFVDNPAIENPTQPAPPGLAYPGNETFPIDTLAKRWTRCFTPIFNSRAAYAEWRILTNRP